MWRSLAVAGAFALALMSTGCTADQPDPYEIQADDAAEEGTAADDSAEWRALFDGESLSGWSNPYDWGEAWVEDGEIRLLADEKFFLVTDETFSDFMFEAEIRMPEGEANSGFMFRANVEPNRVYGYQAEVDPSDRRWSGGLYDEGRRGWLHPPDGDPAAAEEFQSGPGTAFDRDVWNTYRIQAEGDSLKIWVNGELTTAYADTVDREGRIGLQHHGEAGKVYRFRNIRIREL